MNHTRLRRILAPAFSEKAVKEQDSCVMKYVNLLIQKLATRSAGGPVDMNQYFTWVSTYPFPITVTQRLPLLEKAGLTVIDHNRSHRRHDVWPGRRRPRKGIWGFLGGLSHRCNTISGLVRFLDARIHL